jgi:hypothetical protein
MAFQAGAVVGRSEGERDGIGGGVSFAGRLQSLRQAHNGAQGAGKARRGIWKREAWHIYTRGNWPSVKAASVPIADELKRETDGACRMAPRTIELWLNEQRKAQVDKSKK